MKHLTNNSRETKKYCLVCRHRKALFRFRGIVKRDDDHKLCFQCYRSQLNRLRPLEAF